MPDTTDPTLHPAFRRQVPVAAAWHRFLCQSGSVAEAFTSLDAYAFGHNCTHAAQEVAYREKNHQPPVGTDPHDYDALNGCTIRYDQNFNILLCCQWCGAVRRKVLAHEVATVLGAEWMWL